MKYNRKYLHNSMVSIVAVASFLGLNAMYTVASAQPAATSQGTEQDVAARVKQALHNNPALNDNHIDVSVKNGDVVLSGFVQDSETLVVAIKAATKAAGDRKVVNRLSIKQNYPNAP